MPAKEKGPGHLLAEALDGGAAYRVLLQGAGIGIGANCKPQRRFHCASCAVADGEIAPVLSAGAGRQHVDGNRKGHLRLVRQAVFAGRCTAYQPVF